MRAYALLQDKKDLTPVCRIHCWLFVVALHLPTYDLSVLNNHLLGAFLAIHGELIGIHPLQARYLHCVRIV